MVITENMSPEEITARLNHEKEEKAKSVSFSGHRFLPKNCDELKKSLTLEIRRLIEKGAVHFWAGGALGFDMLAEETVLELKKEYPHIRLYLALPCLPEEQISKWNKTQKERYNKILEQIDGSAFVGFEYTRSCMLERNRFLVHSSQYLICYLRKKWGGTSYTVKYAEEQKTKIIRL